MDQNAIAKLEGREFEFFMIKKRISIGRNSKEGAVDVNMGSTRFISRKHLEISFEGHKFFLLCRGKNGIFIDDIFQRREAKRMQLPFSCIIRFPSTQIKLVFTSLIEDNGGMMEAHPSSPLPPSSAFQSPYVTPLPSPTGTISVINSCPASPGGGHPLHPPTKIDLLVSADIFRKNARLTSDSEAGDDEQINDDNSQRDHIGSSGSNSPNADNINTDKAIDDHTSNIDTTNSNPDERIGKDGKKYVKPPFSYAQLIVQALLAGSDRKQTLSNIYQFIADKYPFYRLEDKGWKNSIRHNLSLNQYFMKAPREREGLGFGKGGYWCMHPDYEDKLTSQAYVKRKKKGIPVFPSAGLMSRSAPPSPTHHSFVNELNLREHDSHFIMRPHPHTAPPIQPQFALPSFLPRLPFSASHSLPPSPNRIPHQTTSVSFPTPPTLRCFPINIRSTSTEALALETNDRSESSDLPDPKRPRLSNDKVLEAQKPHGLQKSIMSGMPGVVVAPPCFPLAPRFPFVGLPLIHQPLNTSSSSSPIQSQTIEEKDEEERDEVAAAGES